MNSNISGCMYNSNKLYTRTTFTDEFIAQDRIYMNGDAVGAAVEMAGTLAGLAGCARPVTDVMLYLAHDQ